MQQHLLLLLVKVPQVVEEEKEHVEAEVEEYRDHLDGMDVLIQRLRRKGDESPTAKQKGGNFGLRNVADLSGDWIVDSA